MNNLVERGLKFDQKILCVVDGGNPVEAMNGTIRRVARNVKRWRPKMVLRWTALGVQETGRRFRRIKGHSDLPVLVRALHALAEKPWQIDVEEKAA